MRRKAAGPEPLVAFPGDAQNHVNRLVFDLRAFRIPDFDQKRIKENDGINRFQHSVLPVLNLLKNCISDAADKVGRHLQTIKLFQMSADAATRQANHIKPYNLVIHPVDPRLAFLDQLRLKTAVPVSRNVDGHSAVIALQDLARHPITPVGLLADGLGVRFATKVSGHFRAQYSFHQPNLKFLHQALVAQQILRPFSAAERLVQRFLGNGPCRHAPSLVKHGLNYSYTEDRTLSPNYMAKGAEPMVPGTRHIPIGLCKKTV